MTPALGHDLAVYRVEEDTNGLHFDLKSPGFDRGAAAMTGPGTDVSAALNRAHRLDTCAIRRHGDSSSYPMMRKQKRRYF